MSENKKEKSVLFMANTCLRLKLEIKELQKDEKRYKGELRGMMKDYNLDYAKDDNVEVKITYPKSFDLGLCRMENPELIKIFVKEEKVITINEIFDKKTFKHLHPEVFEKYNIDLTARLSIK